MVIVSDYSLIKGRCDEILKLGYGYSCMSQPAEDEISSTEGLDDVLTDWKSELHGNVEQCTKADGKKPTP